MLMVFAQRMEMILRGPIGPHTVLWGLKFVSEIKCSNRPRTSSYMTYCCNAFPEGEEDVIWSRHGYQGNRWYSAMATIRTATTHNIIIELISDDYNNRYAVLDDFKFTEKACGMYTCGMHCPPPPPPKKKKKKHYLPGNHHASHVCHVCLCGAMRIASAWTSLMHCVRVPPVS